MPPETGARLMVAAPASGAGKTTIAIGLMRALRDRGVHVVPAKSGPDYIDPAFHAVAAGAPSVNLDAWAMDDRQLASVLASRTGDALVVEAAMGLLDGVAVPGTVVGRGSAADLAARVGLPVVLVVDGAKVGQTAVAAVVGLKQLCPDIRILGVILNRVASDRHRRMLEGAMAAAGICVFGSVPRQADLALPSRHLGLVQAGELADIEARMATMGRLIREHVDLDALLAAACGHGRNNSVEPATVLLPPPGQHVAIARDAAFSFFYPHLLKAWRQAGATLTFFSPLRDELPCADADCVVLPGGYPELHGATLAAASGFKAGLCAAAARGAVIYGECGGYMVLGDAILDADGAAHPMLGLLPLTTSFQKRRLSLGYRRLKACPGAPFAGTLRGHEFHYATILSQGAGEPLFDAEDGEGNPLPQMGQRAGLVGGSFAHLIAAEPARP